MLTTHLRKLAFLTLAVSAIGGSVAICAPRGGWAVATFESRLVRTLEERFTPIRVADWSNVTGIVVAGGSVTRAAEALRLARLHPHLRIVLSGPGEPEIDTLIRSNAIATERVHLDRQPQNTYENALMSKALVAPKPGERWLLVTSAAHMPRAIGSFYAVGFHVEPWPVADGGPGSATVVAAHEWLGLVVYWARGRSISLFPGEDHLDAARQARLSLTRPG